LTCSELRTRSSSIVARHGVRSATIDLLDYDEDGVATGAGAASAFRGTADADVQLLV